MKLMVLLSLVTASASMLTVAPAQAASRVKRDSCPNTYCYGQAICNYSAGEACFLAPGGCDGNEFCVVT
jgi:hypothetical protein